jgi:hypothetical protein
MESGADEFMRRQAGGLSAWKRPVFWGSKVPERSRTFGEQLFKLDHESERRVPQTIRPACKAFGVANG